MTGKGKWVLGFLGLAVVASSAVLVPRLMKPQCEEVHPQLARLVMAKEAALAAERRAQAENSPEAKEAARKAAQAYQQAEASMKQPPDSAKAPQATRCS